MNGKKSMRAGIYLLSGFLTALLSSAGLQIGFNSLRFLVQPAWISGALSYWAVFLTGVVGAALFAVSLTFTAKRTFSSRHFSALLFAALMIGYLTDPFYLAELGWRAPASSQALMRGLSGLIVAAGFYTVLPRSRAARIRFSIGAAVIIILHALMERFMFIPILGGDLDLAAMSPVHVFVYLRIVLPLSLWAFICHQIKRKRGVSQPL